MRKTILTILAMFFIASYIDAKEEIFMGDASRKEEDTPGPRRSRPVERHSTVECYYQDGVITIEFEIPEGDAVFTVTDVMTGDNASTTFNTAMEFNYFIGSEPSTYLLEISTSAGNDYEGYLTID